MPFFRDEIDDDLGYPTPRPPTPEEMLETARWHRWCGWDVMADKLIHRVAAGIEDDHIPYEERIKQKLDEEQTKEEDYDDCRNWE